MILAQKYPMPIVFCFLMEGEKVLLYRRNKSPWKGSVTVPGGRKERGETAAEACVREMEEETGFRLGSLKLRAIAHILSDSGEATGYYFSSRDFEGALRDTPEGEPFWCSKEKSLTLEGINPFYRLLAPKIFDEKDPLFEAKITSNEGENSISSYSFAEA